MAIQFKECFVCKKPVEKSFLKEGTRLADRLMHAYLLTEAPCLCEACQEAMHNLTTQTAVGSTGKCWVAYNDDFGKGEVLNDTNGLSRWDDDDIAIFESEEAAQEAANAYNESTTGYRKMKVGELDIDANADNLVEWQPHAYAELTGFCNHIKGKSKLDEASKRRFIQQVEGLTPEEVDEITKFIDARPNIKIDWQHLPDANYFRDLYANYKSNSQKKKDAKTNPFSYFENIPGCHLLLDNGKWQFILLQSWEAAKMADTFAPGGQGAKWCIGWKTSPTYWSQYTDAKDLFVVAISKNPEATDKELLAVTRNKKPITNFEAKSRFSGNFDDGWDEREMSNEEGRQIAGYHGCGKKYMLQIPTVARRINDSCKAWHWYDVPEDCIKAIKWKDAFGVTYGQLLELASKYVQALNTSDYSCNLTNISKPNMLKIPPITVDNYRVVLPDLATIDTLNIGSIMTALNVPRIKKITITCEGEISSMTINKLLFGFSPCRKPVALDLPELKVDLIDLSSCDGRLSFMFSASCYAKKIRVRKRIGRVSESFIDSVLVGDISYGEIEEVSNNW